MRRGLLVISTALACSPQAPPEPQQQVEVAVAVAEVAPARELPREPLPPKSPPTTTAWTTLTVAPGCELQIADTPSALGPPLDWQPCKEGPEGCLEVPTLIGDALAPNVAAQGLAHDGQVTLAVRLSSPGPKIRHVLAPRDGPPFFAVEGALDEQCSLGQVGLSDDGAVVEVVFDNKAGYASRAYLRGPLAEDPAWRQVAAVLPRRRFPRFIGESVLSVGGRVMVEQNGGPLRWFDAAADRWVEVPGSHNGWECCARGHGDAVVFAYAEIPERAMAARVGERAYLLRGGVAGMSPVQIDGGRAVWLEGRGRDRNNIYKKIELWTAEVAAGPALANATRVMSLPRRTMATPGFGGGVVAVPLETRDNSYVLVRLDSDERRSLRPPPERMIERLLWVSSDEVAVQIGADDMGGGTSVMRRIPLAALPPWTAN